jgi:tetratricopeptide (TPR) repeat protein
VPEYVLTAIVRGAPDFFSIRSGIYFFAAAPAETADSVHTLTAGDTWVARSMTATEKHERIAAIESLLTDYEALPSNQRDYWIEMRLHFRLVALLSMHGAYSSALQHIEKLLRLANKLSSLEWKGHALNALGNIYLEQDCIEKARAAYQESMEIARDLGQRENEANNLSNLGIIYFIQGQDEKAENSYKQSLEISQEIGYREIEAHALTGLGDLYIYQGILGEAEEIFRKSLVIAHEIGKQDSESYSMRRLGNIFFKQGRLEEASGMYQQSLEVSRKIGFYKSEGQTLYSLALLRLAEEELSEALEYARQSVIVFEKMEDPQWLEQARELIRDLEQQLERPILSALKNSEI